MDRPDVKKAIRASAFDFERVVCPIIAEWIGGGQIVSIESLTDEDVANIFDVNAGIDAIQVKTKEGIRGIASRIQYGWREDFRDFSMRYKTGNGSDETEFAKRIRAIQSKDGLFFPHWTVQAYLTTARTGRLLYLCMTKTEDLYEFAQNHFSKLGNRINGTDGARFKLAWVKDLKEHGYIVNVLEDVAMTYQYENPYDKPDWF